MDAIYHKFYRAVCIPPSEFSPPEIRLSILRKRNGIRKTKIRKTCKYSVKPGAQTRRTLPDATVFAAGTGSNLSARKNYKTAQI